MKLSLSKPACSELITALALVAVLLTLNGCGSLGQWRHDRGASQPVPSDHFVLPPEGTDVVGEIQVTRAREQDTLLDIARHYDLGYEEIVAANPGVDPWLPGEGTRVVLPTQFVLPPGARQGLVVNLPAMRLFYYPPGTPDNPAEVITHPVGIGREGWLTPQGTMHITHKKEKPAWTVPESVRREHAERGDPLPKIVPPGPDNPLGDFAMRLSQPTYLIHGTNQPYGVGLRVSHGCVRMYPEDIARLFPEVPVGTEVRIINEPYAVGWRDGTLYLEAHQPLAEDADKQDPTARIEKALAKRSPTDASELNWEKAGTVVREARGMPVPITAGSPELDELLARARRVPGPPPQLEERSSDDTSGQSAVGDLTRVTIGSAERSP